MSYDSSSHVSSPSNPSNSLNSSHQSPEVRRLGSYLLEAGLISDAQIEVVLNDQQIMEEMRFGEVLVARGWIKPETIDFVMKRVVEPDRASQVPDTPIFVPNSQTQPPEPPPPPLPTSPPQSRVLARARSLDGVEFDITEYVSQDLSPTVPVTQSTDSGLHRNDRKPLSSIPDEDGVNWAG